MNVTYVHTYTLLRYQRRYRALKNKSEHKLQTYFKHYMLTRKGVGVLRGFNILRMYIRRDD